MGIRPYKHRRLRLEAWVPVRSSGLNTEQYPRKTDHWKSIVTKTFHCHGMCCHRNWPMLVGWVHADVPPTGAQSQLGSKHGGSKISLINAQLFSMLPSSPHYPHPSLKVPEMENHGNKWLCVILNGKHSIWGLEKKSCCVVNNIFMGDFAVFVAKK